MKQKREEGSLENATVGHFNENLVAMICHAAAKTVHLKGFERQKCEAMVERDIAAYCAKYSSRGKFIIPQPYIEYYHARVAEIEGGPDYDPAA